MQEECFHKEAHKTILENSKMKQHQMFEDQKKKKKETKTKTSDLKQFAWASK